MPTATSYTAAAIDAILAQTIKSAEVVGEDLIVTYYDDSTDNLGSVVGPAGDRGPEGSVSAMDLAAAVAAEAAARDAAILAAANDNGRGIVAYDEVVTDFSWLPAASWGWTTVTGLSASAALVTNHWYMLSVDGMVKTEDDGPDNTIIDLDVAVAGSSVVRGSAVIPVGHDQTGRGIHGSTVFKHTGANETKTYSGRVRSTRNNGTDNHILLGSVVPTSITVIDLGTMA